MRPIWEKITKITSDDLRGGREFPAQTRRYALRRCGRHLKSLEIIEGRRLELMTVVATNCHNLESLSLDFNRLDEDGDFQFAQLLRGNISLEYLAVHNVPGPFWPEFHNISAGLKHLELESNDKDPLLLVCLSFHHQLSYLTDPFL